MEYCLGSASDIVEGEKDFYSKALKDRMTLSLSQSNDCVVLILFVFVWKANDCVVLILFVFFWKVESDTKMQGRECVNCGS